MPVITTLINLVVPCIPAALAGLVSAKLSRASKEEWALLAWVPPLPLLAFGLYVGIALARDPTAVNLWPIAMVAVAVLTCLLFGGFLLARKFLEEDQSREPAWRRRGRNR